MVEGISSFSVSLDGRGFFGQVNAFGFMVPVEDGHRQGGRRCCS